jgi:hypothetical protein
MLKTLIRRLDCYLRNEEYCSPSSVCAIDEDSLFGDPYNNPDPLRTRIYWAVRRFWVNHWLCNPRDVYYKFVYAYQRVTRGWDDRAVWSIDDWMDNIMPAMLRQLKRDCHGVPSQMLEGLPLNNFGYHDDAEMKIGKERWDAALDKMIDGFEASARMGWGTYKKELGPYPLYRPKDMPKREWKAVQHERYRKCETLRKRDEKIFNEGMALFVKHYRSLWD